MNQPVACCKMPGAVCSSVSGMQTHNTLVLMNDTQWTCSMKQPVMTAVSSASLWYQVYLLSCLVVWSQRHLTSVWPLWGKRNKKSIAFLWEMSLFNREKWCTFCVSWKERQEKERHTSWMCVCLMECVSSVTWNRAAAAASSHSWVCSLSHPLLQTHPSLTSHPLCSASWCRWRWCSLS